MANYLHGVEIIEVDTGGRTITTPSTSVIGIVGTSDSAGVPVNTPILVTKVKDIIQFGKGTIADALQSIFRQANAVCVVVKVNNDVVSVAGKPESFTGIYALLRAESELKVKPKILLCPQYSGQAMASKSDANADISNEELGSVNTNYSSAEILPGPVATNLIDVADKLRGVAILDCEFTTREGAINFASKFSSSRAYIIDPTYLPTWNSEELRAYPSSPLVAGAMAKSDAERGFWWSTSNTEVKGVSTLNRPIDFNISDPSSEANLLNEQGVGTIIFTAGSYRIWGNRSTSKDNKWHFLSVRRTVDAIYDAIESNLLWALDRPFSMNLFNDIESNLQSYLNQLISNGALLGGTVWVDLEENTKDTLSQGHLVISFDIEPPAPVERLTFKAYRNNGYYDEILK